MRFIIGIPFVNRSDLFRKAVASVPDDMRWCLRMLDNSTYLNPSVPLSASQSINYFIHVAYSLESDVLFFMHNDAEAEPGTFEGLVEKCEQLNKDGVKWGAVFTNYDCLVAFNMKAVKEVGDWDTNFPQYFSDNDYYRRLRIAGYPTFESGLPVKHKCSQTIHSDPDREFMNAQTFPMYAQYYAKKWGGDPGNETFLVPFDRVQV